MMQFELFGVERVQVETAVVYVDHNILQIDFKNPDDHRFLQAMAAKYGIWFSRPWQRHLPLRPLRALRRARQDPDRRGQPHDPVRLLRHDRDRRRRAGRRRLHGRASVRASVPQDRRRPPRERACCGPGSRRRTSSSSCCAAAVCAAGAGRSSSSGPGVATPRLTERGTIANMIAEIGATGAVFPSDDETSAGSRSRGARRTSSSCPPRRRGDYDEEDQIDLAALAPLVAKPSSPGNVVPVEEVAGTQVAQVCIGSSVNSVLRGPGALRRGAARQPNLGRARLGDRDAGLASDPRPDHAAAPTSTC